MTALQHNPLTSIGSSEDSEGLDHLYCCDPDLSLCGLDISGLKVTPYLPDLCIVCDDLADYVCERCGE